MKYVFGTIGNLTAFLLLVCAVGANVSYSADDSVHSITSSTDPVTGKKRHEVDDKDGAPPATAVPLTIVTLALKVATATGNKDITADRIFTLVKGIKAAKGKATIEPLAKALAELIGEPGFKALEKDAVLDLDELMVNLTLREKDKAPTDPDEIERIHVLKDEIEKVRRAGGTKSAPPKSTPGTPKSSSDGAPPKKGPGGSDDPAAPPKRPGEPPGPTETAVPPVETPTIAPIPTDDFNPGNLGDQGNIDDDNDDNDNDRNRNNRNNNNKNRPDKNNQKQDAGEQPQQEQQPQAPSGGGGGGGERAQIPPLKAGEPQSVEFSQLQMPPGVNDITLDMSKAGPREADTKFISENGDKIIEMMNGYSAALQTIIKTGERFMAGIANGRRERITATPPPVKAGTSNATRAKSGSGGVGAAVNAALSGGGGGRVLPSKISGAGTTDGSNGVPMIRASPRSR